MLLSADTHSLGKRIGDVDTVRLYAAAGFDAVDYSFDSMSENGFALNGDGYREYAATLKTAAEQCGIVFNQAHAPFRFNWQDEAEVEAVAIPRIIRSFEIASFLGIGTIIVHPIHHLYYKENVDRLRAWNGEYYRRLQPHAERYGVVIALENMFQPDFHSGENTHDVYSHPEEFAEALDALPRERFTACLDIGHCGLAGVDAAAMIRHLGGNRITSLHIHDNDLCLDRHWAPFYGKVDWEAVLAALVEVDYRGDFTFETFGYWQGFPDALLPRAAEHLHAIGRFLMAKMGK